MNDESVKLLEWPEGFHMKRKRVARQPLETAVFIDLALVLVMFFMGMSKFILKPGYVMELPEAPFVSGMHYDAMLITITREDIIFFNDERTSIDGLPAAMKKMAYETENPRVIIEADKHIPHERIVTIYTMAMDAGIREVSIATQLPQQKKTP